MERKVAPERSWQRRYLNDLGSRNIIHIRIRQVGTVCDKGELLPPPRLGFIHGLHDLLMGIDVNRGRHYHTAKGVHLCTLSQNLISPVYVLPYDGELFSFSPEFTVLRRKAVDRNFDIERLDRQIMQLLCILDRKSVV